MSSQERSAAKTFVERHGLWSEEQFEAAARAERLIEEHNLEVVRLSFPDQHGILRGKTIVAGDAAKVMRNGCSMTTTLLAKDTSHKTVFPVFTAGGGFGMPEMEGGGDFLMIADPTTFRVLPWAPKTGWVLCDIYFQNGKPVPFSTRHLYRQALNRLADAGYDYMAGLEVEFHVFKIENPRLDPADAGWPREPPEVSVLSSGYQYLTETRFDQMEPMLETIRRDVVALGLPLRSVEIELGPSQCEFTFQSAGRARAGRHHDAVPQRGEADLPAAGLSRDLHVPAEGAERDVERLAPASVAARQAHRRQCVRVGGRRAAVPARPALSRGPAWRMRAARRRSPRRRSTATSAIARTRWRPTG